MQNASNVLHVLILGEKVCLQQGPMLPSQAQSIIALWPAPNYTACWQSDGWQL